MQFGKIQVIGLFTMGGQEVEQEVVLACVKDIIGETRSTFFLLAKINIVILLFSDTIDEDGDGNITKDEFVKNATKSDFIKSLVGDEAT